MVELSALTAQVERHRLSVTHRFDEERGAPARLALEARDLGTQLLLDPGEGSLPFGVELGARLVRIRSLIGRVGFLCHGEMLDEIARPADPGSSRRFRASTAAEAGSPRVPTRRYGILRLFVRPRRRSRPMRIR